MSGGQEETVRVDTFQETGRADESVLFQKFFRLVPGTYQLTVTIRDLQSGTINKAELPLVVSPFGTATTSAPILAYQVTGRERLDQSLRIVLNPRGAVAFGGDTLLAYLEGYGYPGPTAVPFEVRTATDSLVYSDSLRFRGGLPVESQFIKLRPDSMALGELRLVVGSKPDQKSVSAVVSFSAAWLVTNFDEMISMLKWFGHQQEVDRLKHAEPTSGRRRGSLSGRRPTRTPARPRTRCSTPISGGWRCRRSSSRTRACPAGAPSGARSTSAWASRTTCSTPTA